MSIAEADLCLRDGDIPRARACLERLALHPHGYVPVVSFTLHIHQAEIAILEGRAQAAVEMLAPLEQIFRREGSTRRVIRLLAARAAALRMLGRQPEAAAALDEAVRLAAPEGYLGVLARSAAAPPGPAGIAGLLPEVRGSAPAFIDRLATILAGGPPAAAPATAASQPAPRPAGQALPEPLSEQEMKVLRMLAAGSSNQAIAEQLVISTGTAKWHVHNILGKLGASSRSQAAAIAREAGLL